MTLNKGTFSKHFSKHKSVDDMVDVSISATGPPNEKEQQEWGDAKYSASLIKEAMMRLDHTDQLSNYERRVALREIKDYIQNVLEDTGMEPTDPKVRRYLKMNENSETQEQLVTLRSEMTSLAKMSNAMAGAIGDMCKELAALWNKHDYAPGDLFEVRVKNTPEKIPVTPLCAAAVQGLLEVWNRYDSAGTNTEQAQQEAQKERYRTMLTGIGVPQHLLDVVIAEVPEGGPSIEARAERLSCALDEFQTIQTRINELGRVPLDPSSALEYSAMEEWLTDAERLLNVGKAWELSAGVPMFVPLGPSFYAGLDSATAKDIPFVDLLGITIKRMKTVDGGYQ